MFPALFLSHGAPTLPIVDAPASRFLRELGARLDRPRAIVVASAHWETDIPTLSGTARPATIHDFRGFPRALYELRYEPPGDPVLAERAGDLLARAGIASRIDPERGLDHGAWVPLLLMYPHADIPTIQVSIQPHLGPAHHVALGRALSGLRAEGVLVIGSGSFTHDLRRFRGQAEDAPATPDVVAFADWMDAAIVGGRSEDLLAYRTLAPGAAEQHPTDEHLLPLYVALGAAGLDHPERLHVSAMYSMLRMDAYAFG